MSGTRGTGLTSCPEVCGRLGRPGLALDVPRYVDYSGFETTADQLRLEAELEGRSLAPADTRILHVGIGDSGFARRFAGRVAWIDGLTVSRREEELARELIRERALPNYRVLRVSKHSRELGAALGAERYDFILDNNLASFACCRYHFYLMLDTYLGALRPDGEILTDQQGMNWACEPGFILVFADLVSLEAVLPLRAVQRTETVYALRRAGVAEPAGAVMTSWVRCRRDGAWVVEPRSAEGTGVHDL